MKTSPCNHLVTTACCRAVGDLLGHSTVFIGLHSSQCIHLTTFIAMRSSDYIRLIALMATVHCANDQNHLELLRTVWSDYWREWHSMSCLLGLTQCMVFDGESRNGLLFVRLLLVRIPISGPLFVGLSFNELQFAPQRDSKKFRLELSVRNVRLKFSYTQLQCSKHPPLFVCIVRPARTRRPPGMLSIGIHLKLTFFLNSSEINILN